MPMHQSGFRTYFHTRVLRRIVLLAALLCCLRLAAHSQVFLKDEFPNLSFSSPVGLDHPNDSTDRLCVVEQAGVIRIFPADSMAVSAKTFLDIHESVASGGELGLLGLAFHPQYAANGYFYVDYTRNAPLRTVISRFRVSASNPDSADRSSEFILLEQLQPFDNHNGGQLAFGPDGYLYIAFGDGGSGGDPMDNGQKTSTFLGKILRINVDSAAGALRYAIPPDNPFAGDTTKKQEIFAYGLRNPWRFNFDRQTLWCGDVGQGLWEEIDTVINGGNYGWNIMEGKHCYSMSGCDMSGLTLPIWEYDHINGRCSITGGFVYRGSAAPSLTGKYLYADYCTGEIWALTPVQSALPSNSFVAGAGTSVSSFGENRLGELYLCEYDAGKIYKIWSTPPGLFMLLAPPDNALNQPTILTCSWRHSAGAFTYHLQVAFDSSFTSLAVNDSTIHDTVRWVGPFPDSTLLFWRVRAVNGVGSTPYTSSRRFTTASSSLLYHLTGSWNLVSVPLDVPDGRRTVLFPPAVSYAFDYDPAGGYKAHDSLNPRAGYWLRFNDTATIGVAGTPRYADTVDVVPGWNLVGSVAQSIPTTQVSSVPAGAATSPFFDYHGSYVITNTIDPGKGYWVRVNQSAKLILSSSPAAAGGAGAIRIEPTTELPPAPPEANANGRPNPSPREYSLAQNYPNPFNPATVIRYSLPAASHVTLKVYNLLGEEVSTVVDRMQEAGYESVTWDANNLPSGIYVYRLSSGGFAGARRMMLLK